MTSPVIQVAPGASVRDAARLLLDKRLGAVPVVDEAGVVVGMVSEGDLLGRSGTDRLSGQEWWLALLSKPGHAEAALTEAAAGRPVREIMHTPVVTIDNNASVQQAAALLRTQGIKRLPVMRDGKMVGIIARAGLLRVVESLPAINHAKHASDGVAGMIAGFFGGGVGAEDILAIKASSPLPTEA